MSLGPGQRPASGQKRSLDEGPTLHPLVGLNRQSRLGIEEPAPRSHARSMDAAAQEAGGHR